MNHESHPPHELAKQVVAQLMAKELFLTAVESCTGGAFASCLTDIDCAGSVLADSFITYSIEAKISLGIPADIIKRFTEYSIETAEAMATAGLRASVRADISVGITGEIKEEEESIAYIAVQYGEATISRSIRVHDSKRLFVKEKLIAEALNMILEIFDK